MKIDINKYIAEQPALANIRDQKPTFWPNPDRVPENEIWEHEKFGLKDIEAAEADLERYAPLIAKIFPETAATDGIIESKLEKLDKMQAKIEENHEFHGQLYMKMDSDLPVAGSIKARGGIYEVLKHAEDIALQEGLLKSKEDDYTKLATPAAKELFSQYKVQVGSTGNLGISIGITAAALGFHAIVHMSYDAKEWKKELLRQKGAEVKEYDTDFNIALKKGRAESDADPKSYFVDDVKSTTLFLGYATSAIRVKKQFENRGIQIDKDHPIFVYSPAGVGGSSGGTAFGMKAVFGEAAHVFLIQPTHCPSIPLGMVTGLNNDVSVQDIGIDGKTEADGLACPSPSVFSGDFMKPMLDGIFTVDDAALFDYLRDLHDSEGFTIEPSSCASFEGPVKLFEDPFAKEYMKQTGLDKVEDQITHLTWATGGSMVPEEINQQNLKTYL
ncbi:MAG TPA: D-serine ammonia-lyase [Candidatus Ligilactobacillus excrementigallinarum]|uniref:Probable D-serine dehydratase n=1 Tax=Candidatus Ligilactobacillus excrementigallinarum TaxID=2838641 RepID=A0A9D2A9G8_9LACO|nr:D-serine ammonia-lyase [Candidatus Ligilactobacillus excrementigallinarum]